MRKIFVLNILLFIFLFSQQTFAAGERVVIGILKDGVSSRFSFVEKRLKNKIQEVAGDRYNIIFDDKYIKDSNFDFEKIKRNTKFLINSREVDIVLADGPVGSHYLAKYAPWPKPVIASVIVDAKVQGLDTARKGSGKRNLNYIQLFQHLADGVFYFQNLTKFKHLGIIIDPLALKALGFEDHIEEFRNEIFDVSFIPSESPDDMLNKLNGKIDALLLTPLPKYSWSDIEKLISYSNKRKIPAFSMWGGEEIKLGSLAGMSGEKRLDALSRRIALQIERILAGIKPEKLETDFSGDSKMVLNMDIAEKLNISPDWNMILDSEIISASSKKMQYGLKDIVEKAVRTNLNIKASEKNLETSLSDKKIAGSYIFPQAGVLAEGIRRDSGTAAASFGQYPENAVNLKFSIRQALYDDEVFTSRYRAGKAYLARENELEGQKLELASNTASVFFQYLEASKLKEIRKANLEISKANLKRARIKHEVGAAGPADEYRWISRVATAKKDLLFAMARKKEALIRLNRILGNGNFKEDMLMAPSRNSDLFWMDSKIFGEVFKSQFYVEKGKAVLGRLAFENAPELKAYDNLIMAQESYMDYSRRSIFTPKLYLKAEYMRRLSRSGDGSTDTVINVAPGVPPLVLEKPDDNAWQVGVEASFPLFTGFRNSNQYKREESDLQRLYSLKKERKKEIRETISYLLEEALASYLNIGLSEEAKEASLKNLDLVSDTYQFGLATSVDLLDALHASTISKEVATTSLYEYMSNMYKIGVRLGFRNFSDRGKLKEKIKKSIGEDE